MNNFEPAETLKKRRPILLACEAVGWFHMAGKARADFLRGHGGIKVDYEYKKWHKKEIPPFPWDDLLGWVKQPLPSEGWPETFAEFTEEHHKNDHGILGLLQAGHGIVSGIEKNVPGKTSEYLGQDITHMWLSSVFGHPKCNLLVDPPQILTEQEWKRLVEEMRRILEKLRNLGTTRIEDVEAWHQWREKAIGTESFIRQAFLSTVAETRLPNNDVTLWDQSYVAAALF